MSAVDFDGLVDRVERKYAGRYRALARRTALIVGLGYAGFLVWVGGWALLGALCIAGAFVASPEASVFLVLGGAVLLAVAVWQAVDLLWLPKTPENGQTMTRRDVPKFFERLEQLRRDVRAPRLHRVALTAEFNASVSQRRRWGMFGWSRNELQIGLWLVDVLTLDELTSVLAHEFAHISRRHGRFGAWIYRTRCTWEQVFARMTEPPKSSFSRWGRYVLYRFLRWYWPRFHAYFFAMSRVHERQADAIAAECAGAGPAASALWKSNLYSRRLDREIWPELWRGASQQPEPPADISRRLLQHFARPAKPDDVALWRQQATMEITDSSDTHPCLAERLASFGVSALDASLEGFPPLPAVSVGEELLGAAQERLRIAVDRQWQQLALPAWRGQHARAVSLQRRQSDLQPSDAEIEKEEVRVARLWERACAAWQLSGGAEAEPLLRQVLELRPTHVGANYALGLHLLELGRTDGESMLQLVADRFDDEYSPGACQALARHFQSTGQTEKLRQINANISRWEQSREDARRELNVVTVRDSFTSASLEAEVAARLQSLLVSEKDLAEAYLVRKVLKHAGHQQLFVLCVRSRPKLFGSSMALDVPLADRVRRRLELPGRALVIAPHGTFKALGRKIMRIPGARIYPPVGADHSPSTATAADASQPLEAVNALLSESEDGQKVH